MVQLLVIAKQPLPGRVKTRLCPPCTPEQAALVAAASLADTLDLVDATPALRRTLAIAGSPPERPGWTVVRQRGDGLGERLAHAFADTRLPARPTLLIGMDTPQARPGQLAGLAESLADADAVLGPAVDGGWWALALRDPRHAHVLVDVPMSTRDTGARTVQALTRLGLTVAYGPMLRDVDTAVDAHAVAELAPHTRFAAAVRDHVPSTVVGPRR
jgi:glycosyltransferase A (GT-A) superfamily protein (DUF2064 family)